MGFCDFARSRSLGPGKSLQARPSAIRWKTRFTSCDDASPSSKRSSNVDIAHEAERLGERHAGLPAAQRREVAQILGASRMRIRLQRAFELFQRFDLRLQRRLHIEERIRAKRLHR